MARCGMHRAIFRIMHMVLFIRCGKTPASAGGEYNKLVSVAGVNPPSDKRSAPRPVSVS